METGNLSSLVNTFAAEVSSQKAKKFAYVLLSLKLYELLPVPSRSYFNISVN